MRTEASWKEQERLLAAARVLAEFSNLEPDGVENFRTEHPDFVPPRWWDIVIDFEDGSSPQQQWQKTQGALRGEWGTDFGSSTIMYMALFASVFDPDEMVGLKQQQKHMIFATPFQITETTYHLALKWLAGNNWQAKTCEWCRRRFIREHSQGKFCGSTCFWAHRKGYKKEKWNKNSDEVNEQRRRKYRLEHPNRKQRRSHAKRKNLRQR